MARKTVVELVDDVDGGQADETVRFALDGVDYTIDLSAENATRLRQILAAFVANARRAAGRSRRTAEPVEDPVAVAAAHKAERKRANREALKSIRAAAERTAAAVQAVTEQIAPVADKRTAAPARRIEPAAEETDPIGAERARERQSGTSASQPAALIVPFQAAGP